MMTAISKGLAPLVATLLLLAVVRVQSHGQCEFEGTACSVSSSKLLKGLGLDLAAACTAVGGDLEHDHSETAANTTMEHQHRRLLVDIPMEEMSGWECDASRSGMGCMDQKILHTMSTGMAHYMMVCMPGSIASTAAAQSWWDAYSTALDCSQQVPKVDCSAQMVALVQAASGDKNATTADALTMYFTDAQTTCNAATTADACETAASQVEAAPVPVLAISNSSTTSTNTTATNMTMGSGISGSRAAVFSSIAMILCTFVALW